MAATYKMRAFNPADGTFEEWDSPEYDTGGDDYEGVPTFGTLTNVHAAYIFVTAEGGSAINLVQETSYLAIDVDAGGQEFVVSEAYDMTATSLKQETSFEGDETEYFKVS